MVIKEARGLNLRILDWFGFAAMYTPFDDVVVHPCTWSYSYEDFDSLLAHECMHRKQRRRDGWLKFWFLICFYYLWYGYENSPYEIEARAAENA